MGRLFYTQTDGYGDAVAAAGLKAGLGARKRQAVRSTSGKSRSLVW